MRLALLFLVACSVPESGLGGTSSGTDAATEDAATTDDAALPDTGTDDGGVSDAGSDSAAPDAGADAGSDAGVDAGADAGCPAGDTRCAGDTLERCDAGDWVEVEECVLGCDDTAAPRCLTLVPSNVGAITFSSDTVEIDNATWDTSDCGALPGDSERVSQGGGEIELCLVNVGSFRLNGTLTVQGPRGLVIASRNEITIAGTIDASANGRIAGPGGGNGAAGGSASAGPRPGANGMFGGTFTDGGGGGGGLCGAGAAGGAAFTLVAGGVGGAAVSDVFFLSPLAGGSGGGLGGRPSSDTEGGFGGGGGGAVQLSAQGLLEVTGTINVAGAGGLAGRRDADNDTANIGAGGGGGSGGGILLESGTEVRIGGSASILAGGGGGGAAASCREGGCSGPMVASAGCDGDEGTTICGGVRGSNCRSGGGCGGDNFGADGGEGGTDGSGQEGDPNTTNGANGGGGGGGGGCIVGRAPTSNLRGVGVVRMGALPTVE
ncbi:MAG: hypothetical protein AAGE52_18550 [Myxococcota bacterium]